jgi:hypothetical protein
MMRSSAVSSSASRRAAGRSTRSVHRGPSASSRARPSSWQFLVRHADRILPVAAFTPGRTVIDVADAESLRRVAERFDTLVLHHAGPDEDVFAVRDVDATYRFVVPGAPGRRRGMPPVPAPVPASAPEDLTAPLPRVGPVPVSTPGTLWGHRFA